MPKKKPKLYFAAPLFTQAEWCWNAEIARSLRNLGYEVSLPQERAESMLNGSEAFEGQTLFSDNVSGICNAAIVVAILDGADPDSGTCWECGYAYALKRPVIGIRTDLRSGGDDQKSGVNLMLSCACRQVIAVPLDKRNATAWVTSRIDEAVQKEMKSVEGRKKRM
jgi:nucleoside 2-deoxyribosyltransferase